MLRRWSSKSRPEELRRLRRKGPGAKENVGEGHQKLIKRVGGNLGGLGGGQMHDGYRTGDATKVEGSIWGPELRLLHLSATGAHCN